MRANVEIRRATMKDILRWYEETGQEYPGWSMRAYVAEHEGRLMGLAGVYYQGKGAMPVAFSDVLPEFAASHKKTLVKAARMVMQLVEDRGYQTLALCKTEGGRKFCEKLGFTAAREVAGEGSVMIWQPHYRIS
jgi:hypothetical protein